MLYRWYRLYVKRMKMLWTEIGSCVAVLLAFGSLVNLVIAGVNDGTTQACISPNSTLVCSDRGDCVSGMCECRPRGVNVDEKYSGQFCECDDYSCPYHDNMLCGGHGQCICGQCRCEPGYTSDNCGCPTSTETCLTENFNEVCNDVGVCECGVCRCEPNTTYTGPTCSECSTCQGKCNVQNRNCALCMGFNKTGYGVETEEKCRRECDNVIVVDLIDQDEVKANDNMFLCTYIDEEEDCRYYYTYEYINYRNVTLQVQKTKECPYGTGDNSGEVAIVSKILMTVLGTMFVFVVGI